MTTEPVLMCGDCLDLLKDIPDGSVDMILADPPYGTTNCKWDSTIPLQPMWKELERIIKPNGAIVLFSQQPFSATLICSNPKLFRYEWIWQKTSAVGFMNAKKMPLRAHENVLVFYRKLPTYNPQMRPGKPYRRPRDLTIAVYGKDNVHVETVSNGPRYPVDVLTYKRDHPSKSFHPTQKPQALLEYLINTYTNPGEVVLDFVMGSGSTGVAAVNTGRRFIGIELDHGYFDIARERIESEKK